MQQRARCAAHCCSIPPLLLMDGLRAPRRDDARRVNLELLGGAKGAAAQDDRVRHHSILGGGLFG